MLTKPDSLSAIATNEAALSVPVLLQADVGGLVAPLSINRSSQASQSLLFVDGGVADYQTLVAGVSSGTEVHVLDSSQDAVTQITNTLLGRSGISSLHIVSHGEAGSLDFGGSRLNLSDLPEYAAQLQSWGKALADDADILLYGCNVAQGELGKAFTSILSQLTGADVAASDDLTGSGGDWDLEVSTGIIESKLVLNNSTRQVFDQTGQNLGVIDFQSLQQSGSSTANVTSPYIEDGYQVIGPSLRFFQTEESRYTGSTSLFSDAVGGTLTLSRQDGQAFGLDSIVLSELNGSQSPGANVTFTGNLQGGGTVSQAFTLDGTFGRQTFNFSSSFNNLTSIQWQQNSPFHQFDDISTLEQIDFQSLQQSGSSTANVTSPYTEDGYQVIGPSLRFFQTEESRYTGSTSLFSDAVGGTLTLSRQDGQAFAMKSIVLSELNGSQSPGANVTFTGNLQGGGTVSQAFTLDGTFGRQTFNFSSSFNNLTSIQWQQNSPFHQFDDIFAVGLFNNPPVLDLNGPTTGTGYTAIFTEGGSGGGIAVVDSSNLSLADSDGTTIASATVTLTNPLNGTAESLAANAGSTGIIVNYNSGTGVLSLSGTSSIANYQQVLRTVTYNNTSLNPSTAPRTINFVVNDGINNSATATSTVNVTAVNNAPTVIAPSAIAVTEDITTTLSGISFADVDASNGIVTATLTVGAGTLGATSGGGVTVGGTATNRTLSGTLAAINSFITGNNLTYTTNLNATTAQTLSVSLNDNGNTGTGGALTSAATVALNVTAVNDAPTVTAPAAIAVIEDTVSVLTGITFADVDASSDIVIATLTVDAGTLAATSGGGVTVGGTATSRTLSGTITDINSFIAASNLTYIPVPDSVATQTLSVSINDNGNTGTGGALSSGVTNISLNVTAVNDAPSFTKGGNQTITAGATEQTIANWATGFNPGPADEASQTVQAYVVTVDNADIFAVAPAIDTSGNLIYTPATNLVTATTATISVRVRDSGGTTDGGIDTSVVQTFTITVKPQPTISITTDSQDEGDSGTTTAYTFTVSLSDTSTQEVRVNYATADGTATIADGDYTAASGTLIFAPGETSKTFTVNGSGDNKYENTEAFLVNFSNAINGTIASVSNSVNGRIVNDDSIPVANITPTLTQAEGNSGVTPYVFTVTLSNPSFQAIDINYTTQDGTATAADGDYTAATGTVNFAPGEISKTITVNATGDTKFEANETFQVALTGPFNGPVAPGSIVGSGTINNDDAPPTISIGNVSQTEGNSSTTAYTFTVSLSNASTQTVAVNYTTADGTATVADSDYTAASGTLSFAPGETSKTITVLVNGDTKFEADQAFSVGLSNASNGTLGTSTGTGTIVNDDTRPTISINSVSQTEGNIGTTPYAFTASLSNATDETVTVNYATANGTATICRQ
jgi:hypothetical protein